MVAPPRFERGPPRPGRGALASCATGLCLNAEDGPETPPEMASPNRRIPKPTASRTRFSVFWRHYLLAVSLIAVGTRHVPLGSAMPFASLQRDPKSRGYLLISASIAN